MCGIVGAAGTIYKKERDAFNHLLLVDYLRGPHSTGVAHVNRLSKEVTVVKKVGGPMEMFDSREYEDIMTDPTTVLIGHNRFATQGAVNKRNAHPFDFDSLVGVHNGTLKNQSLLLDHKHFEVDSENIFYNIEHEGIEETHQKLDGAYALVWWDKEKETLSFVRNKERPFYFCFSEDHKTLFWASEACFLKFAMVRLGIKTQDIISTDVHTLYTFKIPSANQSFGKYKKRKLKEYKRPFTVVGGNSWDKGRSYNYAGDEVSSSGYDPLGEKEVRSAKVPDVVASQVSSYCDPTDGTVLYSGYKGEALDQDELDTLISEGCRWCNDPLIVNKEDKDHDIYFIDDDMPLCESCAGFYGEDPSYLGGIKCN